MPEPIFQDEATKRLKKAVKAFEKKFKRVSYGRTAKAPNGKLFLVLTSSGLKTEGVSAAVFFDADAAISNWLLWAEELTKRKKKVLWWRVRPQIEVYHPPRGAWPEYKIYSRLMFK